MSTSLARRARIAARAPSARRISAHSSDQGAAPPRNGSRARPDFSNYFDFARAGGTAWSGSGHEGAVEGERQRHRGAPAGDRPRRDPRRVQQMQLGGAAGEGEGRGAQPTLAPPPTTRAAD